jgi:hypothetical protein
MLPPGVAVEKLAAGVAPPPMVLAPMQASVVAASPTSEMIRGKECLFIARVSITPPRGAA